MMVLVVVVKRVDVVKTVVSTSSDCIMPALATAARRVLAIKKRILTLFSERG